jgi:hypothetical protein
MKQSGAEALTMCLRTLVMVCVLTCASFGQNISVMEAADKAREFDGKAVQLKGVFRFGFEWSELYCYKNGSWPQIWAEFPENDVEGIRKLSSTLKGEGTVNVIFEGLLYSSQPPYGHSALKQKIVVKKVVYAKRVSRRGSVYSALTRSEQEKVQRWCK